MKRWFALQTEDEMRFFDGSAGALRRYALLGNVAKSEQRDQRRERFHDILEDAVTECEQDGPSDGEVSLPLNSVN